MPEARPKPFSNQILHTQSSHPPGAAAVCEVHKESTSGAQGDKKSRAGKWLEWVGGPEMGQRENSSEMKEVCNDQGKEHSKDRAQQWTCECQAGE